ncbi:MAG: alcohol dehydrogenase catalytic domain-containing protein [Nitrosopumilus sp.]|jgi:propanol-preferring alcohol dehydrogenase|nr:alcohol dehydrogenase catalytic domain-containing protein [Nitrosopumilus sp.]
MKSARIPGPNEPLEIIDLETPKPQDNQVVVKVKAVGVCHSDLHLWEGGYDLGDGQFMKVTDRGVKYPVTPGHEIVGTVEEMGSNVKDYSKGDEVLVYPWIGCGECPACKVGNENLCDAPKSLGVFQDGGYSDFALVPHYKYLAKLSGVDPESATSLACSALTAYNAIKKANANSPEFLVIIGAGGLGLMGVQIAHAITSAKIICVDLDDKKLETAKEMGADFVINSKDTETSQKIISICNEKGAESVVDFVNAPPTAKLGLSVLRKRGNLVLVGLFGGSLELSLVTIPLKSITIQGAYTGNYNDMVELLDLTRKGIINPKITKRYQLSEANTALEDLKARKIIGRAVINP